MRPPHPYNVGDIKIEHATDRDGDDIYQVWRYTDCGWKFLKNFCIQSVAEDYAKKHAGYPKLYKVVSV